MPRSDVRQWTLLGVGFVVGCSLIMEDLPPPPDEGAAGSESEAGSGSGGDSSAGAAGGGGVIGAAGTPAAGGEAGAGGTSGGGTSSCADECDCDGDGAPAQGVCGGDDCDDDDPDTLPGQEKFFYGERAAGGWDYDCSGQIELEHEALDCSGIPSCNLVDQGFVVPEPQCGTDQDWGRCVDDSVICMTNTLSSEPVNCH
jgi:hypothetical protein